VNSAATSASSTFAAAADTLIAVIVVAAFRPFAFAQHKYLENCLASSHYSLCSAA
jgi:hypothetical protein